MSTFTKAASADVQSTPRDPTDPAVRAVLAAKPQAAFPTGVAVVRVQDVGYRTRTASGYGTGKYCIVTTRDVEKEEHFDRLSHLPQISGIAPLNRLLLPSLLQSDLELRQAAAALHADVLLVYTLDTTFRIDEAGAPLTVISLGLAPNKTARVFTTASAILLDTRSGYVYGVAESTEKSSQLTSSWTSGETVDQSRQRTESAAFDKLVGELEKTWPRVVSQYSGGGGGGGQSGTVYPTVPR
jgi:hypothetical protein